MPSFDIVSEVDMHEVTNAVDQANREVTTRFDFKGTGSKYERDAQVVTMTSQSDFQLKQMLDILREKLNRRGVELKSLSVADPEIAGSAAHQKITVREGLDTDLCRKLVKEVKGSKLKVQAAIQGNQVRVSGKKRDDLQKVIAMMKELDVDMPLQFTNFRD